MAVGIGGGVLEVDQAGRTVRALTDAEDAAVAAVRECVLVEHGHRDGEALDGRDGGVGEVGRTEPLGGRRHEVLHERDRTGDGRDGGLLGIRGRGRPVDAHSGGAGLRRLALVTGEAVTAQGRPLGEWSPRRIRQRLHRDVLETRQLA